MWGEYNLWGQHQDLISEPNQYNKLEDSEIITLIRQGDQFALDYLIQKYRGFVRVKASMYFLVGADHEDIVQEGMIGLYKAIRDYDSTRRASFRAFADLCIIRQIITAIKTATRQKHIPLNSYISLDKPIKSEESERTLLDVLTNTDQNDDPEKLVINQESHGQVEGKLVNILSRFECDVLTLYLDGQTYQEISDELNRHVKSVDNALQRTKRKLERYFRHTRVNL